MTRASNRVRCRMIANTGRKYEPMWTEYVENQRVPAPAASVFDLCCDPDALPALLVGVDHVRALSFTESSWHTDLGGTTERTRVLLTDFHPCDELAWRTRGSNGFWLHLDLAATRTGLTEVRLRLRRDDGTRAGHPQLLRLKQFISGLR